MDFIEDDHMLKELTAEGPDHPFRVGILPRRARGNHDFFDAHVAHPLLEMCPVDIVPVAQEIP